MTPTPPLLSSVRELERLAREAGSVEWHTLETQLVLRAGHLPSCGEGAEFPWECTCDYGGFMEQMGRVLAAASPDTVLRLCAVVRALGKLLDDLDVLLPYVQAGDVMLSIHGGHYDGPEGGIPAAMEPARAALRALDTGEARR